MTSATARNLRLWVVDENMCKSGTTFISALRQHVPNLHIVYCTEIDFMIAKHVDKDVVVRSSTPLPEALKDQYVEMRISDSAFECGHSMQYPLQLWVDGTHGPWVDYLATHLKRCSKVDVTVSVNASADNQMWDLAKHNIVLTYEPRPVSPLWITFKVHAAQPAAQSPASPPESNPAPPQPQASSSAVPVTVITPAPQPAATPRFKYVVNVKSAHTYRHFSGDDVECIRDTVRDCYERSIAIMNKHPVGSVDVVLTGDVPAFESTYTITRAF